MIYVEPESLKIYQLDTKASEIAKCISGKEFEKCSEAVKIKAYEFAIQIQTATMMANISASLDDLAKAIENKA